MDASSFLRMIDVRPIPPADLDIVEPLWRALFEHHVALTPHLRDRQRTSEQSWRERRAIEQRWLADAPESFVLGAYAEGALVGYAFVRIARGSPAVSWSIADPHADLATLSVAPQARGMGVGRLLMSKVYAELRRLEVLDLEIDVISTNVEAARFYEHEGAVPFTTTYLLQVP